MFNIMTNKVCVCDILPRMHPEQASVKAVWVIISGIITLCLADIWWQIPGRVRVDGSLGGEQWKVSMVRKESSSHWLLILFWL